MTLMASDTKKSAALQEVEEFKLSVADDDFFLDTYWAGFDLFQRVCEHNDEPIVRWLNDWIIDRHNFHRWNKPDPMVIVGVQRQKTPEGRRKLNISRSHLMGNHPFVLKKHGGDCETAAEATNKYIQWLWPRLRDTSSQEYAWFESASELMHSGQKLILGCCGDDHCHGHWIAHLLNTGDWRRWDTIDVEDWCNRAIDLLSKNWHQFDAFDCTVEPVPADQWLKDPAIVTTKRGRLCNEYAVLESEAEFLNWDELNSNLKIRRLHCFTMVVLGAHGPDGARHLVEKETVESFLNTVAVIRETGDFPKTEQQKQQSAMDELIQEGASKAEIMRTAALKGVSNTYSLERYAEAAQAEKDAEEDILEAIDKLMDAGEVPEIRLEDYVPAKWIPGFRVLRDGLKFQDDVLVAVIVCCVGAMLPPTARIQAKSMEEKVILWMFLIGTSGVAKSVLIKLLCLTPLNFGVVPAVKVVNGKENDDFRKQKAEYHKEKSKWDKLKPEQKDGKVPPSPPEPCRKKNVIYTSPTTQGIRADLAEFGPIIPSLLAKDELSSWFKEMGSTARQTDMEFYLSAYDGSYSNEVFADARLSREVTEAALSVLGGTQPKVFLQYLEAGNANGFNARPLFFQVPRLARTLLDKLNADHDLTVYLGDLYEAAFRLGPIDPLLAYSEGFSHGEGRPVPDMDRKPKFWLSESATEKFVEVFNHLEEKSISAGSDEIEALWAKAPGQVLRVAAAIQFMRTYTGMEPPSDDWQPPDELLPHGFWRNLRQRFNYDESLVEDHVRKFHPRVSTETIILATRLVIAGKTQGVDLVERGKNPIQEMLRVFLAYTKKHTPKSSSKGVKLSTIRKNAWNGKARPSAPDIKQMAQLAKSQGLVVLVEGGTAVRSVR